MAVAVNCRMRKKVGACSEAGVAEDWVPAAAAIVIAQEQQVLPTLNKGLDRL